MNKYQVQKYFNEALQHETILEADSELSLVAKLVPRPILRFGSQIISSLTLKSSDTEVQVSPEGVLFYYSNEGEEILIKEFDISGLLEPVGGYSAQVLAQMDVETYVFKQVA